jgi:hypothetical protein
VVAKPICIRIQDYILKDNAWKVKMNLNETTQGMEQIDPKKDRLEKKIKRKERTFFSL